MWGFRKKTRVAPEVILEQMRQQAAERRRDEGRPPVKDAWAPVLAESGTDLRDIRVECEEDDPQPMWRETAMVRFARTAGRQAGNIKILQGENDVMGAEMKRLQKKNDAQEGKIKRLQKKNDEQEAEIERLQEENEWQEAGNESLQKDNERLQKENDVLRLVAHGVVTTMVVKDLQEKELCAPLCCPISMQLFKDPVVSIYGHSFERRDIQEWLVKHERCPMTRDPLTIADLTTNFALAGVADAFRFHQVEPVEPPQQ